MTVTSLNAYAERSRGATVSLGIDLDGRLLRLLPPVCLQWSWPRTMPGLVEFSDCQYPSELA